MFSRSSSRKVKRVVPKPVTITVSEPEQPTLDLSKVKITIQKPTDDFIIMVDEQEGEEDE